MFVFEIQVLYLKKMFRERTIKIKWAVLYRLHRKYVIFLVYRVPCMVDVVMYV